MSHGLARSEWAATRYPYGRFMRPVPTGVASGHATSPVGGAAGHFTAYRGAAAVRTQAGFVRTGFTGYHYFNAGWYTAHPPRPGAQSAGLQRRRYWRHWAPSTISQLSADTPKRNLSTTTTAAMWSTRTISVYYNGDPVATAEEYTDAKATAASPDVGQAAKPDEKEEWQSLGVFAIVQGEEKDANNIFQLAINKDGVIRGNYYNGLTDTTVPVSGSVEKQTQRAAWVIGDKKETVYETGVGNLTKPESAMLVHLGKDRTQQWTLVRLEQPEEMK